MMARLTKHQKEVLLRLCAASTRGVARPGRFVYAKDLGEPSALANLYFKGYADRVITYGPRGGEHKSYRPSDEGWKVRDRHFDRAGGLDAWARGSMLAGEIDSKLITARRHSTIVRVMCGAYEYRGVPGEVERDDTNGVLYLRMGKRLIPLRQITEVIE